MPITFAQPEPVAADAAFQYGAYPVQQQQREMAQRRSEFLTQAGLQASAQNAQSRAAAGGLLQGQQQYDEQAREHQYQAQRALAYDANRTQFVAQQQRQETADRFALQAWLQGQELSQAEQFHMQRLQNTLGQVMSDDTLDPAEKKDLIFQLRTGIDPLKQRQERARAKLMESEAEQHKQQAMRASAAIAAANKVNAMSFEERNQWVVDPGTYAELDAQVPPVNPALAAVNPQAFAAAQEQRRKQITAIAARQGRATHFFMHDDGKWEQTKPGQKADHQETATQLMKMAEQEAKFYAQAAEAAQKEADLRHPPGKDDLTGKEGPRSSDNAAYAAEVFRRHTEAYQRRKAELFPDKSAGQQQSQPVPRGAELNQTQPPAATVAPWTPGGESGNPVAEQARDKMLAKKQEIRELAFPGSTDPTIRRAMLLRTVDELYKIVAKRGRQPVAGEPEYERFLLLANEYNRDMQAARGQAQAAPTGPAAGGVTRPVAAKASGRFGH